MGLILSAGAAFGVTGASAGDSQLREYRGRTSPFDADLAARKRGDIPRRIAHPGYRDFSRRVLNVKAAPGSRAALPAPTAPFPGCPNLGYQVHTPFGASGSEIGYFDLLTSTFFPIAALKINGAPIMVNAIGYERVQNVFWGMRVFGPGANPYRLIRIDSQGNVDDAGPLNNSGPVPAPAGLVTTTGTVVNGRYGNTSSTRQLIVHTNDNATSPNRLVVIDIDVDSPTFGGVLKDIALSRTSPGRSYLVIGDWDVNPADGQLYSIEMQGASGSKDGSKVRELVRIDPNTGAVTDVADLTAQLPDGQNYGLVYVEDASGTIYVSNNDVNREFASGQGPGYSQTFGIQRGSTTTVTPYVPGEVLAINDGADCLQATDFGDAPESYRTFNRDGGPGHIASSVFDPDVQLTIGTEWDSNLDGLPGANADGDDTSTATDDEDGLAEGLAVDPAAPALSVPVTNTTATDATLAAWIDFDLSGTFDPAERAVASVSTGGDYKLTWTVPPLRAEAAALRTYARIRLYPGVVDDPQPVGAEFIQGGEIEDHVVNLGELVNTGIRTWPLVAGGIGLLIIGSAAVTAATKRRD